MIFVISQFSDVNQSNSYSNSWLSFAFIFTWCFWSNTKELVDVISIGLILTLLNLHNCLSSILIWYFILFLVLLFIGADDGDQTRNHQTSLNIPACIPANRNVTGLLDRLANSNGMWAQYWCYLCTRPKLGEWHSSGIRGRHTLWWRGRPSALYNGSLGPAFVFVLINVFINIHCKTNYTHSSWSLDNS